MLHVLRERGLISHVFPSRSLNVRYAMPY
jgi:hypothetical protein